MTALDALLAFAIAALAAVMGTPVAIRAATRLGAVDAPDGRRKSQKKPVALGGGVVVAVAATLAVLGAIGLLAPAGFQPSAAYLNAALPSAMVLILVGLIDDTIGLTGIYKLIGQVLSASLLATAGFHFESISLLGWTVPLGDFGIPFSIFFCLGAINAFNLIDGADGLASSIGAVVCLTLGVIAASQGSVIAALASFAASGALVGFLRYNAPPARVYLGDTGSMLIGWLVAAVSIRCAIKEQAAVALVVPIAICAIPILDAAAAIVRRVTTGQSVFTADRGHLHHALLLRGWTVAQTAMLAAALTATTCAGAIASYFSGYDAFAFGSVLLVATTLAAARVFGHAELRLLYSHVRRFAGRVRRRVRRHSAAPFAEASDHAVQIQGRRKWDVLWTSVREAAGVHQLGSVRLNVNIPHLHESYYASWKASDVDSIEGAWRLALPLNYGDRTIGRLLVSGRPGPNSLNEMQQLLDYFEPLESEMARLVEEVEADATHQDPVRRLGGPRRRAGNEQLATATDYY